MFIHAFAIFGDLPRWFVKKHARARVGQPHRVHITQEDVVAKVEDLVDELRTHEDELLVFYGAVVHGLLGRAPVVVRHDVVRGEAPLVEPLVARVVRGHQKEVLRSRGVESRRLLSDGHGRIAAKRRAACSLTHAVREETAAESLAPAMNTPARPSPAHARAHA